MPISANSILPFVVNKFITRNPQKTLDLGIGNGIIGALFYNYATVLLNKVPHVTGVEAWADYKNPMWELYNYVYVQDLRDPLDGKFDMIVMLDVIEHLHINEGRAQIKRYKEMLNPGGIFIVSTPSIFCKQGAYKGNDHETHRSLWTMAEFSSLGMTKSDYTPLFGELMLMYEYEKP